MVSQVLCFPLCSISFVNFILECLLIVIRTVLFSPCSGHKRCLCTYRSNYGAFPCIFPQCEENGLFCKSSLRGCCVCYLMKCSDAVLMQKCRKLHRIRFTSHVTRPNLHQKGKPVIDIYAIKQSCASLPAFFISRTF